MDMEPVMSNRNCSLVRGGNSPKQIPMDMGREGGKAILSVRVIARGLPGYQGLHHIHVFISIPETLIFRWKLDRSLLLVESNQLFKCSGT